MGLVTTEAIAREVERSVRRSNLRECFEKNFTALAEAGTIVARGGSAESVSTPLPVINVVTNKRRLSKSQPAGFCCLK